MRILKTLAEWFGGFDPVERPRHPELPTMPRSLFETELSKQLRRKSFAIDRDIKTNARNLGRED